MNRVIKVFAIVSLMVFSACFRGESKSLSELLTISKNEFNQQSRDGLSAEAAKPLEETTKLLATLETTGDGKAMAENGKAIAEQLSQLLPKTGYTGRPALTELRNQYLALGEKENGIAPEAAKLLVARTYGFLASELETTRFSNQG